MRVLFLTNIPNPYRNSFFDLLGREVELDVLYEAKYNKRKFDKVEASPHYNALFLSESELHPSKVNTKVFRYLKRKKYDLIVATTYNCLTELAAIFYMILFRIPYHLEIDGGFAKTQEKPLNRWIKRTVISHAQSWWSPNQPSDDFLKAYGAKAEKIHRYPFTSLYAKDILDTIPSNSAKEQLRTQLGITQSNVILTVGQFIHRKGFDVLLKSLEDFPLDVEVLIVGDKPTQTYLDLLPKSGKAQIRFLNFMSKGELANYYQAADLFVLPTREDIWGLVINEAMANGLPVITTTRCGSALELVEENLNGFLVQPEDEAQLRHRMLEVLSDPIRMHQMSLNSLLKIRGYSFEAMARTHLDVWKARVTK